MRQHNLLSAIAAVFCFSLLLVSRTLAQIPSGGDTTSTPAAGAHDYFHSAVETVNPANGSTSIRIPVRMPKGRQLAVPFSFAYDSNGAFFIGGLLHGGIGYQTIKSSVNQVGGWSYTFPVYSFQTATWQIAGSGGGNITCWGSFGYVFQDPAGNRHDLDLSVSANYMGGSENCNEGITGDGEYPTGGEGPILATTSILSHNQNNFPPVTVTDGNGTVYNLAGSTAGTYVASSVVDRNGNTVSISNSSGAITYTDTIGRTALHTTGMGGNPDSVTLAGLSSAYKIYWTTASASFTDTMTNLCTVSCGTCPTSLSASSSVVSRIVLPNSQQYTFTYDPTYGMLTKLTYPTGGYVRYVWGLRPNDDVATSYTPSTDWICEYGFPAITDRYVSYDGSTETLHQHFAYASTWSNGSWTSKTTTVTTTDTVTNTSFTTVYTYSSVGTPYVPNNPSGSDSAQIPVENSIQYNGTNGSLLKTVAKSWYAGNLRLLGSEQTTLDNGQSSLALYCYNSNEQVTEVDEYDLGTSAPSLPSCANGVPPGTVAGPLLRKTIKTYASFTAHIVDLPATLITKDGPTGSSVAETDTYYDQTGGSNHGNPTTITKQCFDLPGGQACPQGNSTTIFTYDTHGQMLTMTDPKNNQTSYSYTDNYSSCGGNAPPTSPSDAYLTQVTYPQTNGVNHIVSYCYDYTSDLVLSSTDQNGLVTRYKYADSLDRATEMDFPDGGKTTISYNDTPPSPTATATKKIDSSGTTLTTVSVSNGFGMVKQTQLTSDPQGTVYTDTAYDGLGRVYTVSNPYRSGSDPTTSSGTTTFLYDALSRKTSTTYPDSSLLTSAYCGPNTLVTDPAGRWRRSTTDGLGRLIEVDEPNAIGAAVNSNGCPNGNDPIWKTVYTLDALGNLTNVLQNGSHGRSFAFDSLGRMLTSNNPEVGLITYTYDASGNVSTKMDARNITISLSYDALNREITRAYSNSDPTVATTYDQPNCLGLTSCQNIGYATSVTDAAGSESWAYQIDSTNQRSVHQNQRTTKSVSKGTTYYFNLAGNVTSISYPTGRVVNYSYSAADRAITAQDSANGITYATGPSAPLAGCLSAAVCFTPQGSIYSMSIGVTSSFAGLNVSETFNNRLQPTEIKASSAAGNALDISYSFVDTASGKNAGHVNGIANNLNPSRSQSFTYDQLNRIISAGTSSTTGSYCWGYQYSYDAWGNLSSQAGWTPTYNACTESTMGSVTADGNNHITGLSYDASGNTLSDGNNNYTWNGDSMMTSASGITYAYDSDERRVAKVGSKLYWYGSGGEILAETDASGNTTAEYVFFAGRRVALLPSGTNAQYYAEDFLGSSRVVTQNNGALCYDADFPPYGQERAYTNTCIQNAYKFEGKERDPETQNDEFGARNYSWRYGRWLSADWSTIPVPVPYANLTNPQTLNLYAMVADDPESFADLDGHAGEYRHHCPDGCEDPTTEWNAGIEALACDPLTRAECGETAAQAAAEWDEMQAQQAAAQTSGQQAGQAQNTGCGFFCKMWNWLTGKGWGPGGQAAPTDPLISAQNAAMTNPNLQPGAAGAPSHCSQATCQIAQAVGANTGPLNGNANSQAENLAQAAATPGSGWHEIPLSSAQEAANQGHLVVFAWRNPQGGSGHTVTGRPDLHNSHAATNPMVAQIGGRTTGNGVMSFRNAFGADKRAQVRIYEYTGH